MSTINENNLINSELSFEEIDYFLEGRTIDDDTIQYLIYTHMEETNDLNNSQNKNLHINLTRVMRRLYDDEDFIFPDLDISNGNDARSMYYTGDLDELDIEDPFF